MQNHPRELRTVPNPKRIFVIVNVASEAILDEDKQALQEQMDKERQLDDWQAKDGALWWKRWYMKAGHKRLGRILVAFTKKVKPEPR